MKKFPFYKQSDHKNCGPTCIKMIASFYKKNVPLELLTAAAHTDRDGTTLLGISDAADSIGLKNAIVSVDWDVLKDDITYPCIAHWKDRHFIVIYKIKSNEVYVADPAFGRIKYNKEDFLKGWMFGKDQEEGVLILFEPTPEFSNIEYQQKNKQGFRLVWNYLKRHKKQWLQVLLGVMLVAFFQICFPFLTQAIVDVGINTHNLNFVYTLLLAQLMLVMSQTSVQVIRDWLLLFITNKININLLSDYLIKLMKLPLSYYDSKSVGDIMQRIQDNERVQSFMSSNSLSLLFSIVTFIVFSVILLYYNLFIFIIFLCGAILYVVWSLLFLKKRAEIDYRRFDAASGNQSSLIQLITGMSEIKINNSDKKRRWEWESIQVKLFKIAMKGLAITQVQTSGGIFINETKNILITVISASLVIKGEISLGMMLAIQYIVGQLNGPISNFVSFIQSAQDAKLSIRRMEEVYELDNEEDKFDLKEFKTGDIILNNLSFRYGDSNSPEVLSSLSAVIEDSKVTAIVGVSGSGKTTLLKLLLKYYNTLDNELLIGDQQFNRISAKEWRASCGVVMQDGYIFTGTIEENIAESELYTIDRNKVVHACKVANIYDFIMDLPNGLETVIGRSGMGLSGGQRQRILIARAIYKEPHFLFFDEATSALDTENETKIMENLYRVFKDKTVLIIAHRLSTVKNADNIIVLDEGKIIETGNHDFLVAKKGKYYELIKNQLNL